MRKIVSLLMMAVLATTFAAGCAKMKRCEDANGKGKTACENKEGFEGGLECKWSGSSDTAKDGVCAAKGNGGGGGGGSTPYTIPSADTTACEGVANPDDQSACIAAQISQPIKDAGYTCTFVPAVKEDNNVTPPVKAEPAKCELKKKM